MKWKPSIAVFVIIALLLWPRSSRGDMFGGDLVLLSQMLSNAIHQLTELRRIAGGGEEGLELLRQINDGIHQAVELTRILDPNQGPGVFSDWTRLSDAIYQIERIYGMIPKSPEAPVQKYADRGAADAITKANDTYRYAREADELGEQIKHRADTASPTGAQKSTMKALGQVILVLNQILRNQATQTELLSQSLLTNNRNEKKATEGRMYLWDNTTKATKQLSTKFSLPKF